jgi:ribosomal protein S18 acetylase RimI-like enzyme
VTADVRIEEARVISDQLVEAVGRLVSQLSPSAPTPTAAELQTVVQSSATRLLLALDADGAIAGMLTLAIYPIPTDRCAWIEDVVVDEQARGRGIGEQLIRTALQVADQEGVRVVDLTSRAARHAANRLYRRVGFKPRETNIYRLELSSRR